MNASIDHRTRTAVSATGLSKTYGPNEVLDGVNLTIDEGEVFRHPPGTGSSRSPGSGRRVCEIGTTSAFAVAIWRSGTLPRLAGILLVPGTFLSMTLSPIVGWAGALLRVICGFWLARSAGRHLS